MKWTTRCRSWVGMRLLLAAAAGAAACSNVQVFAKAAVGSQDGAVPIAQQVAPSTEFDYACDAANKRVNYGEFSGVLPADFKRDVERYRSDWRKFCKAQGRGFVAFARLNDALERILEKFNKLSVDIETGSAEDTRRFLRFSTLTCQEFPHFIPVFKCLERADGPAEYEEPSFEAMSQIAKSVGSTEDKLFFAEYSNLVGAPFQRGIPWRELFEAGAVFQGCVRFGQYDWVGAFKKISLLKKNVKRESYAAKVLSFEKQLLNDIETIPPHGICACGPRQAVITDYRSLLKHFQESTEFKDRAPKIKQVLAGIEEGRISVTNDREKHCGGG